MELFAGSSFEDVKHARAGRNLDHLNTYRHKYTNHTFHFLALSVLRSVVLILVC